jgi:hypothetical protein
MRIVNTKWVGLLSVTAAPSGRPEVTRDMSSKTCPRCGTTFTPLDDMRFWSGTYEDTETGERFDRLCEACHKSSETRRLN